MKLKNPYHYLNDEEKGHWITAIGKMEEVAPKIYDKPRQSVAEMKAKVRKLNMKIPLKRLLFLLIT